MQQGTDILEPVSIALLNTTTLYFISSFDLFFFIIKDDKPRTKKRVSSTGHSLLLELI